MSHHYGSTPRRNAIPLPHRAVQAHIRGRPANARVDDVNIKDEDYTGEYSKFEVLY